MIQELFKDNNLYNGLPSTVAKRLARRFGFGRYRVQIPGPRLDVVLVFFRGFPTPPHLDMSTGQYSPISTFLAHLSWLKRRVKPQPPAFAREGMKNCTLYLFTMIKEGGHCQRIMFIFEPKITFLVLVGI
jgi:hypothetical protein